MTRTSDRHTTDLRKTDRRALLKWAMLGGGAALARLFAGPLACAATPTNSPVGSMTNLTLDLTNENFGIHEHIDYSPLVEDIFHGALQIKDGYAWISEQPGWGIEVDAALAAKHPITDEHPNEFRTKDGSVIEGTG
jgi:mannonate dehydratase